uniref:Uncharacterized protein n=1 Tax=Anguilla anguilla TaxID=7936 RepID=A0A0E9U059_ANGAN
MGLASVFSIAMLFRSYRILNCRITHPSATVLCP